MNDSLWSTRLMRGWKKSLLATLFFGAAVLFILLADFSSSDRALTRRQQYSVATASPGGTYYAYGGGWSNLLNQELGMSTSTQVTGGAVDNVILVGRKRVDFGIATSPLILDGYLGTAEWTGGRQFVDMRVLFMTHPAALHIVSKASTPIRTLKEIDDKRICVGPAGSSHDTIFRRLVDIFGLKPDRVVNMPFEDAARQLGDSRIDMIGMTVAVPNGTVTRLSINHPAHLTELLPSDKEMILQEIPYLVPYTIPANTYKSMEEPVNTLAVWSIMITDKEKPAEVIKQILKVTFANKDALTSAHAAARYLQEDTVLNAPIPLHSGAVEFYRGLGLRIPAKLVPPESK